MRQCFQLTSTVLVTIAVRPGWAWSDGRVR
jgi:hypothetical protein